MGKIITQCPSCEGTTLHVVKIECANCNTKFEGQFDVPVLLKLPEDDLQFILDFVRCSGSLKDMAVIQKVSYPTLRNRLNALITTIEQMEINQESYREDILHLLEEGRISAKDAAIMLKKR